MAAYSQFLGGAVKVHYRLGDILLSASGTFVGDSGRSIFLEQYLEQHGRRNYFRWEIPYPHIHRVVALTEAPQTEARPGVSQPPPVRAAAASAAAGASESRASRVIPFRQRPTTA